MKLSNHFTLAELTRSQIAVRHDIAMDPPAEVLENLGRLCVLVLDPIRVRIGAPVVVTSGYRPMELNRMIGGAANSDHVRGLAADIHALGKSIDELGRVIDAMRDELPLRQCILEFDRWIHVSVTPAGIEPRRQFLTAAREFGKTVYRVA